MKTIKLKVLLFSRDDEQVGEKKLIIIARKNNKVVFSTSKNSPDSRYFYKSADTIIVNQATGGDNHKPTEWLDFESLKTFNQIQWEFLNGV